MSDEQSQIKVVDKRRSATKDSTAQSEPTKEQSSQDAKPKDSAAPGEQASQLEQAKDQQHAPGKVDFTSFIMSLCTQAIIMLGEVANPETGIVSVNLEAAKQTIDILLLLQEKTKGNLTEDEDKLMTELVSSLQMAYVNKVKG